MSVQDTYYIKAGGGGSTPIGAKIIKTGQTVSYRTGDDGDLQKGRATDFLTLLGNNPFGNTFRFTGTTGSNTTIPNNIVLDWTTYDGAEVLGYGYFTSGSNAGTNWDDAIDDALAYSVGTYTSGWRLPNIRELQNLQDWSLQFWQRNYAPFNTLGSSDVAFYDLWSSTSLPEAPTSSKLYLEAEIGYTQDANKTNNKSSIPVRTFTVTGTVIT